MKWAPNDCKSGDMIRIRLGSIYHYGIFVSEDEVIQFGYPPLPEFKDKNQSITVDAVNIDEFSSGKIVEVAVHSLLVHEYLAVLLDYDVVEACILDILYEVGNVLGYLL